MIKNFFSPGYLNSKKISSMRAETLFGLDGWMKGYMGGWVHGWVDEGMDR